MKNMKMLGLAAIAAMGLMAFVGAGSASATTFFTDAAHTNHYPAGTTFHQTLKSGTSVDTRNTSGTAIATCTSSTLHGKFSQETATWIGSKENTLTFSECSQTTDVLAAGATEFMWTSGGSAEVRGSGSEITFGIFGVSCTYGTGTGTTIGTITSGAEPVLTANATLPKIAGGFLCPSTAVLTGEWVFTSPHAVFMAS